MDPASFLTLVFVLVLIGVGLYLLQRFVPMDPQIASLIRIVVIIAVVAWLFFYFLLPLVHHVPRS
jgi:hypothetical protein